MNAGREITATVYKNPYANRVEIRLASGRGEFTSMAEPVIFRQVENEGAEWTPAISLTPNEAQALFDEFCRAGFKPTHQVDAAGALQATREHLADMREIAFSGLRAAGIQPKGGAA